MRWNIVGPNPTTTPPHTPAPRTPTVGTTELKMRAQWLIDDIGAILDAARARQRTGSWDPDAAPNWLDAQALAAAEDIVRRQRKNRR